LLVAIDIPLVARNPAQNPNAINSARGGRPFQDLNMRSRRKRFPAIVSSRSTRHLPDPAPTNATLNGTMRLSLQHSKTRAHGRNGRDRLSGLILE
jgi:hypothetical protein